MGSILALSGGLLACGLVVVWLLLAADRRADEALERDEREISRGRQPGVE